MSVLHTLITLLAPIPLLLVVLQALVLSSLHSILIVVLHCFFRREILRLLLHLPLILFIEILVQKLLVTLISNLRCRLLLLLNLVLVVLHDIIWHHRILLGQLFITCPAVGRVCTITSSALIQRYFIIVFYN